MTVEGLSRTVSGGELPDNLACPHCESRDTELMSPFGSVLANAQYYCNGCSTTFEYMKWDEA